MKEGVLRSVRILPEQSKNICTPGVYFEQMPPRNFNRNINLYIMHGIVQFWMMKINFFLILNDDHFISQGISVDWFVLFAVS